MRDNKKLYTVRKDVECGVCKNKGAIKSYGRYYPIGMGKEVSPVYEKYENVPYLRRTESLGSVIPYECLSCDNRGYIGSDFGGFEGYKLAFQEIL